MAIIPPPPPDVAACGLYTRLLRLSKPADGLAERVGAFVASVKPLLDLIMVGPFREYTLHNPDHAKKLVHLAEFVVAPDTLDTLTPLELAVIIMSCHLHDLGMCLTSKERSEILSDPEFQDELRRWPQLWDDLQATRKMCQEATGADQMALEARIFQLQEAALSVFLRPRHATRERYVRLTTQLREFTGRTDLFSISRVSFEEELIAICMSHNLDVGVLAQTTDAYVDRFPRALPIAGQLLNTQFCACVLRIVDIMDFDRERSPRVLFESLGIENRDIPGSAVTLQEWNKHMAVHSIDIDFDEEIVVFADSRHPAIERSIRDFSAVIEREIRDTTAVLRKNSEKVLARYKLQLPVTVRAQVRSLGYVYKDLAFQLDESAITRLLMGESLYSNKTVALRELIQNAVDACQVRGMVDPNPTYSPHVRVFEETDDEKRIWLVVEDNGIGMDESILSRFFFKIGTSYYTSEEFQRLSRNSAKPFVPISRFGIGILSVFMIGDELEVRTRNSFSARQDTIFRTIRVEGRFGLAFVTQKSTGAQGTTVRVRLTQRSPSAAELFLIQAASYVRTAIRRPAVPVSVELPPSPFEISPSTFIGLRDGAEWELEQSGMEAVVLDIGRWSKRMSGRVILFFFRTGDGKLTHRKGPEALKSEALRHYLSEYRGNTITVNGISMALRKVGRVLGQRERRLSGVIDVELRADPDVKYDVARDRLVEVGATLARQELRQAIVLGLRDLGIANRLDEEAQKALESPREYYRYPIRDFRPFENEEVLLKAVMGEIPPGKWPVGLHRIIAERLSISPSLVYRAMSALLESGRIIKDKSGTDIHPSRHT